MKSLVTLLACSFVLTACSEFNAARPGPAKKPKADTTNDYVVLTAEELFAKKYEQVNVECDAFDGSDVIFSSGALVFPVSPFGASTAFFTVPNKALTAAITVNRPELATLDLKTNDQITSQVPMIKVSGYIDAHEGDEVFQQSGGIPFTGTLMPELKDYQSNSGVLTVVNSMTGATATLSVKCQISRLVIRQGRL